MSIASLKATYKKPFRCSGGFTLVETIIALGIGVAVAMLVVLVTSEGMRHINAMQRRERLHAHAVFLTDSVAYWVRQAEEITVPSSSQLNLRLPDGTTRVFEKSGDQLAFEGNVLSAYDITVQEVTFSRYARSVRLAVVLAAENGEEGFPFTTTVAQRNTF